MEIVKRIKEENFIFERLTMKEANQAENILTQWVRDSNTGILIEEELEEIKSRMKDSSKTTKYPYLIIKNKKNKLLGFCGFRKPEKRLQNLIQLDNSYIELINVFVDKKNCGKGLGASLMTYSWNIAKELGYKNLIWSSGPRYKETAWSFYNKLVGEPVTIGDNYFGRGRHAPVWIKKL